MDTQWWDHGAWHGEGAPASTVPVKTQKLLRTCDQPIGRLHSSVLVSPQQPVAWQPSKDGERLIGRILLNKRMKDGTVPADTGALLGLKVTLCWCGTPTSGFFFTVFVLQVVGGKMTESGRLCAFITKVKRGSLADTVGRLRPGTEAAPRRGPTVPLPADNGSHRGSLFPGDQVLEWNGRVLQGATFNEVYNIILESKAEPQVELVVSRPSRYVWWFCLQMFRHDMLVTCLCSPETFPEMVPTFSSTPVSVTA